MPTDDVLFNRLVEEGRADEPFALYVLAACASTTALDSLIDDDVPTPRPDRAAADEGAGSIAPVYLSSISVRGFRGIADEARLTPAPGPGVTLVVGRNGSGKSSFAEAAEVVFTGTSVRWEDRTVEWAQGWRNLHAGQKPLVALELNQQGVGPIRVERKWPEEAQDVRTAQSVVVWPGGKRQRFDETGWHAALEQYRPFLSYSELGQMLTDGHSRIYQAVIAGLGLEDLTAVRDRLQAALGARKKQVDEVKRVGDQLLTVAQSLAQQHPEEARFSKAVEQLSRRTRDVDALAALVMTTGVSEGSSHLDVLVRLTPPVEADRATALATQLRERRKAVEDARGRTEGQAYGLSKLLREALDFTSSTAAETCPVCNSPKPLDAKWRKATEARLKEMDAASGAVKAAERELATTVQDVQALCAPVPPAIVNAAQLGMAEAATAKDAWERWSSGRSLTDAEALAAHIEQHLGPLTTAVDAVVAAAKIEVARRDAVWQPFAVQAAQWVGVARATQRVKEAQAHLKTAKDWLDATIDRERDKRFEPVRTQAIRYWNQIAVESNVKLEDIELQGRGKQCRVTLKVTVDGTPAPALGVLSQGELNTMTLSLFLPRILLDETPFGFVLVDDPVQAMDEARVDGLARVLADVARRRQVIVFTHDARLPEAFERLSLPHSKIRVNRGAGSHVKLSPLEGAWQQRLKDALAVALTENLPESLGGQVVPNFCRAAIEAACHETLRRRWLQRGDNHEDVEDRIASAKSVRELLAYAFFDDAHDLGKLDARLDKLKTKDAATLVRDCNNGTHEGFPGDLREMVKRTTSLCEEIRKVKAP